EDVDRPPLLLALPGDEPGGEAAEELERLELECEGLDLLLPRLPVEALRERDEGEPGPRGLLPARLFALVALDPEDEVRVLVLFHVGFAHPAVPAAGEIFPDLLPAEDVDARLLLEVHEEGRAHRDVEDRVVRALAPDHAEHAPVLRRAHDAGELVVLEPRG